MSDQLSHLNDAPSALNKALARLLRPLVKLLLHFQITYPAFSQLLKQVYVEVADKDFAIDGKAQTDSRISLLTGVHRKDVKRLREIGATDESTPVVVSLGTQIVSSWLTEADYQNDEGLPLALPKQSAEGEVSFETLVSLSAKQDIRPRSVLDELLNLGIVRVDDDQQVHLVQEAFVPEQGFDEKAFFFGKNLHDHVAAGAHNLVSGEPPQFDRSVYYNNLKSSSVETLREFIGSRSMDLLKEVNAKAKAMQKSDSGQEGADFRFNLGAYFWIEEQIEERVEENVDKPSDESIEKRDAKREK